KRNGYYGKAGTTLTSYFAHSGFLLSYARAFLHTGDSELWEMARNIAKGNGIGDLGYEPGTGVNLNRKTDCSDPITLFAILDLYQATNCQDYLDLGRIIGNQMVDRSFHKGYFVKNKSCIHAKFDALEPFALIALQAAIENKLDLIPDFVYGAGFIS